ncbi:hypothetical protein [Nocardiopsis ansamitocini]|uniref:Uncharacterized protein n=1 Tax=Nocardiopsis ansamitocini TaxID=1670832 RepID=A0A9W6PA78_9ACTN|nr:hypothetical protein [Nocardiopsis ansamitocini]GLU49843.1 hypothetical protein Nans01_41940 [Nocardiopsis ansamitocini]
MNTDYLTAQQRSARVLDTLLSMRLPGVEWSINSFCPDRLDGQLSTFERSVEQARADLTAWATVFNATVEWERHGGLRPQTLFTVNGVTVRVWTTTPTTDEVEA